MVWRFKVCLIWAKREPGAGGKEDSARVGARQLEVVDDERGGMMGDLNLCWFAVGVLLLLVWGDRGEGNSGVSGLGTVSTIGICFSEGDNFFSISFNLKHK